MPRGGPSSRRRSSSRSHSCRRSHSGSRSCNRSRSSSRRAGAAGAGLGRLGSRSPGGREFCKLYNKGECNRRRGCWFSHNFKPAVPPRENSPKSKSRSSGPPVDRFGKEMCEDFSRGKCTRGDRCKYSHDSGPRSMVPPVVPPGMPPVPGMYPMYPMGMPPHMMYPGMMHGMHPAARQYEAPGKSLAGDDFLTERKKKKEKAPEVKDANPIDFDDL
eukprot:TRINITY_DN99091_c0_g1_i1.p2 TRINITY_DN99091_c0_g1~~TRINITY_DN99091_c0_g1_i1.p2  ORF type:complete len:224 (+),score=27.63 TRINITY_DN99091_c0_g1_i1:27-674(+)